MQKGLRPNSTWEPWVSLTALACLSQGQGVSLAQLQGQNPWREGRSGARWWRCGCEIGLLRGLEPRLCHSWWEQMVVKLAALQVIRWWRQFPRLKDGEEPMTDGGTMANRIMVSQRCSHPNL